MTLILFRLKTDQTMGKQQVLDIKGMTLTCLFTKHGFLYNRNEKGTVPNRMGRPMIAWVVEGLYVLKT